MSLLFGLGPFLQSRRHLDQHPDHDARRAFCSRRLAADPRAVARAGGCTLPGTPAWASCLVCPSAGSPTSPPSSRPVPSGSLWLTGGDYGPEACSLPRWSCWSGIVVLVRVTRDYAWHYTYVPDRSRRVSHGCRSTAAHVAMEQAEQTRAADSLVQSFPPPRRAARLATSRSSKTSRLKLKTWLRIVTISFAIVNLAIANYQL